MKRRDFLKTLSVGAAAVATTSLTAAAPAATAKRPNIVVILTDDMGFSDLGCYGGEIETPNLDALAAGGVRFTEFYGTARCWPTRATLMSGRYSNGIGGGQVAIPQVLKPVGYQTAMVGKWHLSRDTKKNSPMQRGFDDFYGTITGAGSFYNPMTLTRGTQSVKPDGKDYYYTDKIGSEAVRQIENFAKSDKPFFQYVAFTAAHWPLHAPEKTTQKYIERYKTGWEKMRQARYKRMLKMGVIDEKRWPLPEREKVVKDWDTIDHKEWRIRNMAVYAAMVDHMDQAVGEIVKALKKTGKLDNTLIIYTNDNGACPEHLHGNGWNTANNVIAEAKAEGKTISVGDNFDVPTGGPYTYHSVGHNWANAQNTPMRRYKSNVHEGGSCVPCIMHWSDGLKIKAGSITQQRGHMVDIMSTCIDLAGAKYPDKFDGKKIDPNEGTSLVPAIKGGKQDHDRAYYFNHSGTRAVIKGDWKVICEGSRPWELHNITIEKTEITNLADKNPKKVEELVTLWETRFGKIKKKK
ncbi:MAG: arylsulfatase [Phycisphaerales bacterium]|jgi:arylsulfatase A-like enzyme|nr:arylsulfatase [Phycisphaerales bacterium]